MGGRVGAVINYASQTDAAIAKHPTKFTEIVKIPTPFIEKFKYLMFSHGFYTANPQLVEAIWDELRNIRESGGIRSHS